MKKNKNNKESLEWIIIPFQYYGLISRNALKYEIIAPYIVAYGCASIYTKFDLTVHALKRLSDILPTVISLLIGFTVMLITILLTSGNKNIEQLKSINYSKSLHNNPVTLYQALHIQFCYLLLREVALLLVILLYLFLLGLHISISISFAFLWIETGMTLSILIALVRSITNLYLSFFNSQD